MKTNRLALFLLMVMAFVGYACRDAGIAGEGRIISIDQFDRDASFKLSSVVDSISYVVLETNEESLLGNVTKIVHRNHAFFIGNADESNAVLVFSETGKFLRKLYSVGQGPGEYLTIDDFCVSNDGAVSILDARQDKIITFNAEGAFEREIPLQDCDADYIGCIDGQDLFVLYSSYRTYQSLHNLMIVNTEGEVVQTYLPISKTTNRDLTIPAMDLNGYASNTIQFCQIFDDLVYRLEGDQLKVDYQFDFDEGKIPAGFLEREVIERNHGFCMVYYTRATEDCFYYGLEKNGRIRLGFYFKEDGKHVYGCKPRNEVSKLIENDLDGMPFMNFVGSSQQAFYSTYPLYVIKQIPNAAESLKSLAESMDEEDNPLLVIFHIGKSHK
jgi:hypothetical protein